MSALLSFTKDDIFLLSNIAARAVTQGWGGQVSSLLKFIQAEIPNNAIGYMLHAIYLYSVGAYDEAIAFLENINVFDFTVNGPETFAFFLVILKEKGDFRRVKEEAQRYRSRNKNLSEAVSQAIDTILSDIKTDTRDTASTSL